MPALLLFFLGLLCGALITAIIEGFFQWRHTRRIERLTAPRVTQLALDQAHAIDRTLHSEDLLPCDVEPR